MRQAPVVALLLACAKSVNTLNARMHAGHWDKATHKSLELKGKSLGVVGIGAMLMFQVVVNINMTIGLGPITGIPLPWLSYGRSAMLVNFISLGLCASVSRRGGSGQGRW